MYWSISVTKIYVKWPSHVSPTHKKFQSHLSNNGKSTSRFITFNSSNFSVTCNCNTLYYLFLLSQKRKKKTCINSRAHTYLKSRTLLAGWCNKKKAKKESELSTCLADYTHTCAPTCQHLARECRRERQSAFLLLHSSYIHYCRITHIYIYVYAS